MKHLQAIWRGGKLVLFTVAGWLVAHGTVLAHSSRKGGEPRAAHTSAHIRW